MNKQLYPKFSPSNTSDAMLSVSADPIGCRDARMSLNQPILYNTNYVSPLFTSVNLNTLLSYGFFFPKNLLGKLSIGQSLISSCWYEVLEFIVKKSRSIFSPFQHSPSVSGKPNKKLYYAKFLAVFSLFAALIFLIQLSTPGFVGIDPYYYLKISELTMQRGILKEFPWMQTSIWKNKFVNKEFLFHVYLMPFIYIFPNLMIAGKVAISVLGGVLFTLFYRFLKQFQVPHSFIWTLIAFGVNYIFVQRVCMVRPHVLSLILILLFIESLWTENPWKVLIISLIYPLTYTAAHFLIFIAIIYVAVLWIHQRVLKINLLLLTFVGVVGGLVLHPQFPNNLETWYVQNALLPVFNWGNKQEFWFVSEVKSLPVWAFIGVNSITLLLFSITVVVLILNRRNLSSLFLFIFILASVFLGMTIFAIRFVEYWVPFTVLACALGIYALKQSKLATLKTAVTVGHIGLISFSGLMYVLTMLLLPLRFPIELEDTGHWLKVNAPEKAIVFTANWSDFPQLFYFNAQNYYLFGLDPVYCYAYDADVWNRWVALVSGQSKNPSKEIKDVFGANYVLCSRNPEETEYALTEQLLQENQTHIVYEDEYHFIFSLE